MRRFYSPGLLFHADALGGTRRGWSLVEFNWIQQFTRHISSARRNGNRSPPAFCFPPRRAWMSETNNKKGNKANMKLITIRKKQVLVQIMSRAASERVGCL